MNNASEQTIQEVIEAFSFASSIIMKSYIAKKDIEEMKNFLRDFDSFDLTMLSELAVKYEEYEICQSVRDILQERSKTDTSCYFFNRKYQQHQV